MIDSSKWDVIEEGLKHVQGRPVVNSVSLKEGEDEFLRQARLARRYGAAVIVMAFDEQGQADTVERKVSIARRAFDLLTQQGGFDPSDVIVDPNIFAIGTGIEEHADYGNAYLEATRQIKRELPAVLISGGVSNVSFCVPRQRRRARGDTRRVPVPRHQRGHGHGHRQRRRAARCTTTSRRTSASAPRTSSLTAELMRRNGCSRSRRRCAAASGAGAGSTRLTWREAPVAERLQQR